MNSAVLTLNMRFRPSCSSRIDLNGGERSVDHVVLKPIVSTSADSDAAWHVQQVVGLDDRSACEVVKVDADNT